MSKYLDGDGVTYLWGKMKEHVSSEVETVKSGLSEVYRFKGSVDNLAALKALPREGLTVGDVYNVKDTKMNYAWTGNVSGNDYDEGWDSLGGSFEIETLTTSDIDELIAGD